MPDSRDEENSSKSILPYPPLTDQPTDSMHWLYEKDEASEYADDYEELSGLIVSQSSGSMQTQSENRKAELRMPSFCDIWK